MIYIYFVFPSSRASGDAADERPRDPSEARRHAETDDAGVGHPGVESPHDSAAHGRSTAPATQPRRGDSGQDEERHSGTEGT